MKRFDEISLVCFHIIGERNIYYRFHLYKNKKFLNTRFLKKTEVLFARLMRDLKQIDEYPLLEARLIQFSQSVS